MRGSSALRAAWRRLSAGDYSRQWTARAGDGALGFAAPIASRWVPTQTMTMSTLIPPPKSLGEVTHVNLLNKEDSEAIDCIWREYHEGKSGRMGARVHPDTYGAFRDRSTSCPIFVVPLHKSPSKFLTLVMQAKMPYASFTAIDDFRELQEAAPPMMVAAHYPELMESKDMVLVQATHVDADTGAAEHASGAGGVASDSSLSQILRGRRTLREVRETVQPRAEKLRLRRVHGGGGEGDDGATTSSSSSSPPRS